MNRHKFLDLSIHLFFKDNGNLSQYSELLISFLSFFFTHPDLFKVICGSDMGIILNNFIVFSEPNTSHFSIHMFLDLFFYSFFNDNEINVNIPNFCPPVYVQHFCLEWNISHNFWTYYLHLVSIHWIHSENTEKSTRRNMKNNSKREIHKHMILSYAQHIHTTLKALYVGSTLKVSLEQYNDLISTTFQRCSNVRCPLGTDVRRSVGLHTRPPIAFTTKLWELPNIK